MPLSYFLVLPTDFSSFAKYMLIIVICLPVAVAIYELLVRRINLLRVLFGLKPLMHAGWQHTPEAEPHR